MSEEKEIKEKIESEVTKRIEHVVKFEGSESESTEMETLRAREESLALSHLEKEKNLLLREAQMLGISDFTEDDINSPYDLEHWKGYVEAHRGMSKPQPTGKVTLNLATQKTDLRNREFESHEQMVDFLVSRKELADLEAMKRDPNQTVINEGRQAQQMLNELWETAIKSGRSQTSISGRKLTFEQDPSTVNPAYVKDPKKLRIIR